MGVELERGCQQHHLARWWCWVGQGLQSTEQVRAWTEVAPGTRRRRRRQKRGRTGSWADAGMGNPGAVGGEVSESGGTCGGGLPLLPCPRGDVAGREDSTSGVPGGQGEGEGGARPAGKEEGLPS